MITSAFEDDKEVLSRHCWLLNRRDPGTSAFSARCSRNVICKYCVAKLFPGAKTLKCRKCGRQHFLMWSFPLSKSIGKFCGWPSGSARLLFHKVCKDRILHWSTSEVQPQVIKAIKANRFNYFIIYRTSQYLGCYSRSQKSSFRNMYAWRLRWLFSLNRLLLCSNLNLSCYSVAVYRTCNKGTDRWKQITQCCWCFHFRYRLGFFFTRGGGRGGIHQYTKG